MDVWIIPGLLLFEAVFVALLVSLILRVAWNPIQSQFPEQAVAEPHLRRNFQSFSFGSINAGFSFHVVVDDEHLHLLPVRLLRITGAKTASIPWSAISFHDKQPWFKKQARVRLGATLVVGPAWCFELSKIHRRE